MEDGVVECDALKLAEAQAVTDRMALETPETDADRERVASKLGEVEAQLEDIDEKPPDRVALELRESKNEAEALKVLEPLNEPKGVSLWTTELEPVALNDAAGEEDLVPDKEAKSFRDSVACVDGEQGGVSLSAAVLVLIALCVAIRDKDLTPENEVPALIDGEAHADGKYAGDLVPEAKTVIETSLEELIKPEGDKNVLPAEGELEVEPSAVKEGCTEAEAEKVLVLDVSAVGGALKVGDTETAVVAETVQAAAPVPLSEPKQGAHVELEAAPRAADQVPAEHRVGVAEEGGQKAPAGQEAQVALEAAPRAADHVPAPQGVGWTELGGQKEPEGHNTGVPDAQK